MRYFDLHCDTLTECFIHNKPLGENDLHVDLKRGEGMDTYIQCCAVWIPDDLRGEAAFQRFCGIADRLDIEIQKNSRSIQRCKNNGDMDLAMAVKKHGAVLTVENAAALGGSLERINDFRKRGVRMCTLTWNGENELGRGVMAPGNTGLSPFGRKAVEEFENAGIIIDISHASPEMFYDVAQIAKKPFVASHSNSKKICSHSRNLTDDQFTVIKKAKGLVGLNFYIGFLNNDASKACMEDVLRHAEHFLSLGGECALSLGGDFDGAELSDDMKSGLGCIPELYELFLRHNYSEDLVRDIFYGNAYRFFKEQELL